MSRLRLNILAHRSLGKGGAHSVGVFRPDPEPLMMSSTLSPGILASLKTWPLRVFSLNRTSPLPAIGIVFLIAILAISACSPAATPAPTAAPTLAPAKPAGTTAPANKPSAVASPAAKSDESQTAKPAATTDWKAEWDRTVAAAKSEGKVVFAGPPGDLYRTAFLAFQKSYPDIQVDYSAVTGATFPATISSERDGGKYLWDVYSAGWEAPLMLRDKGILDPVRPILLLPEVLDESKWLNGFMWVDKEQLYLFQYQGRMTYTAYVNREVAPESELSTIDQLLDPKWKGKIASQDPRPPGAMSANNGYLVALKGEDWVRRLLSQNLVIMQDGRQLAEALVRGTYPIGMGVASADLEQFARQGLTSQIKVLDPDNPAGRRVTSGFGNVMLINKAPHPNAAKVFINWLLSREGQQAYVDSTAQNSRRLDVTGPADSAPNPNVKYEVPEGEGSAMTTGTERARAIASELIK